MSLPRLISLMLFVSGDIGLAEAAAAPKRQVRAKAAAPTKPKLSDTEILARTLVYSQYDEEALAGCDPQTFKNLAIALNMNRDWMEISQDEFETSDEYAARREKLDGALSNRKLLICEPLADNEDAPFRYDADRQYFIGSFKSEHNVWRDGKNLGTYRAKTRMGVPMTVKASLDLEYNVSLFFDGPKDGCVINNYENSYAVAVDRANAPLTKAVSKIAYVGHLQRPYSQYSETTGQPSLDDPYDYSVATITVHFALEKVLVIGPEKKVIWGCDVATGKILSADAL